MIWGDEDQFLPSITWHIRMLRDLPCMVSGRKPITLHHARGGSIAMCPFGSPGSGEKQLDALQIPLHLEWHVGRHGVDTQVNGGVASWESRWGRQVDLLNSLCQILGYSVWRLAYQEAQKTGRYITVRRVDAFLLERPSHFLQLPTTCTDRR